MEDSKILDITKDVKWIGVLDRDIITFVIVMTTEYGTTYNSYFINAEKKAVIETVKEKFWDSYLQKIKALTDPASIEFIIVNHTEPDHSGCVKNLLKIAPNAKVVGSGNAIRYLNDLMGEDFPHIIVKDGDTIDLGDKTIRFISAPNLHWPDSIYSYLVEDKLLFTCDSFGSHFCDARMYDDEVGNFDDAFKYYFDVILKPFSKFILKAIEKIRPLEINAICTGHGPILRSNWRKYVSLSEQYAKEAMALPGELRVFIAYVSAYNNTKLLAEKIAEGVKSAGKIEIDIHDIETMSLHEIENKIAHSSGLVIGSPTINQNTLLQIYQLFALINPIRDKGKPAAAFGSYGWSGEAAKIIETNLTNLKLNFIGSFTLKFSPHEKDSDHYIEFGKDFGKKLLEQCQ